MAVPFLLTINTSTLIPFSLSVPEQIDCAATAGFGGIELWVRDIISYVDAGGQPEDLKRQADDAGVKVVNGIAFFKWSDKDPAVRAAGIEQARREIDLLARVGCTAVAAPPTGTVAGVSVGQIGLNFKELLTLGRGMGVEPILEFWGRSPVLHSIQEAREVLGVSDSTAKMLLDLFHMYTGGSRVDDLPDLARPEGGSQVGLVHINDYPLTPARETITDADRVMPGDGEGPVGPFLRALSHLGFAGPLSVELFRPSYDAGTAEGVAREALQKTIAAWDAAEATGGEA